MSDERHKRQQIPQLSRSQMKALFQNLEFLDETPSEQPPAASDNLVQLEPREQDFVRHWVRVIARSDPGLARLFAQRAPEALRGMNFDGVEAWLLKALEAFDQRGLGWALEVLDRPGEFAETRATRARSLVLTEVAGLLQRLVIGLGGRELRLAAHASPYTDTETLYLPTELEAGSKDDNFRLYKAMAVHHWAQTWYGTWHPAALEVLLDLPDQANTVAVFGALERLRLDACISRDLAGAYRDMRQLSRRFDGEPRLSGAWQAAAAQLQDPSATISDSCRWLRQLADTAPPDPVCYQGDLFPEQVRRVLQARLQREKQQLQRMLGQLRQQQDHSREENQERSQNRLPRRRKPTEGFSLTQQPSHPSSGLKLQLHWDERPLAMPDELQELLNSIVQDLGEVPEDYFKPGGQKPYDAEFSGPASGDGGAPLGAANDDELCYPEWDYTRQRFRRDYCILREHTVAPGDSDFVPRTLQKYRGLLKSIRRTFEAMLGESRLERRQPHGDDIDLDALVAARADARHGEEMNDAIYTRLHNSERSIAVMFMVDMSGSTKGWVNEAEREALVLLCEALETIGDGYAIYGFSGRTHRRVDIYHVKRFDEPYSARVRGRISGISPRAYTRMGAPIRHLGGLLGQVPARNKLLITLSDGKPEDYGSYYGKYGIEDTRHALLELSRDGIHPFCITIDKEGGDYLPYMYGAANFACIDEVRKLPLKVADIYRKLTT